MQEPSFRNTEWNETRRCITLTACCTKAYIGILKIITQDVKENNHKTLAGSGNYDFQMKCSYNLRWEFSATCQEDFAAKSTESADEELISLMLSWRLPSSLFFVTSVADWFTP